MTLTPNVLLGLLAVVSLPATADAASVTTTLDVNVVFGPGAETLGTIKVTYDDDLLVGENESLGQPDVALELDLFSQTFTNENDVDYPDFPVVEFEDFEISFIDFVISEFGNVVTPITEPGIGEIFSGFVVDNVWEVTTSPVPLPAGFWLLSSTLGVTGFFLQRRRSRRA